MSKQTSFIDIVNQYIESEEITLPVFNTSAMRVHQELTKKHHEVHTLERIIAEDQALSSQVLKIANSPFYKGLSEISTVHAAIMRLGIKEIGNIVMLAASKKHFNSNDKQIDIIMKKLWQHSVGCAYGAVWIAKRHEYGVNMGHVFFAGLLHDVGKLFILMVIENIKKGSQKTEITDRLLDEAMQKLHASQGYQLMMKWNMPEKFCVIARDHDEIEFDTKNYLLVIIRMANLVCHKMGIGLFQDASLVLPATLEANLLNLSDIDLAELEIMLEDTRVLSG